MLKPKHRAVLGVAAERAGWGRAPGEVHQGLAQLWSYGIYRGGGRVSGQ